MFNLIRRISYGVIPRPDRPWEEDPTSNAPQIGRKRRLSSTERDVHDDDDQANKKKARGESATPSVADAEGSLSAATPQVDTQEVKEVTQGVKEVDLDGKGSESESGFRQDEGTVAAAPESVPLPDEKSGELDELASDGVDVPAEAEVSVSEPVEATKEDDEDVQSSSAEENVPSASDEAEKVEANNELTTDSPSGPSTADADATTKD